MKNKGFTLVELLIVVAVIGILAAMAVPRYQRFVQKARKGEAQTMLAAIGLAETAFYSERGIYGNNLARMGVEMDGSNFNYAAGVDVAASCATTSTFIPNTVPFNTALGGKVNMVGKASQVVCLATTSPSSSGYVASATGAIRTMSDANNCKDGSATDQCDKWQMDNNRVLTNTVDGVK